MKKPILFNVLKFIKNLFWLDKVPLLRSISKVFLPFTVTIQGSRMKPVGLRRYLLGVHEPGTTTLCKKIIQEGDTVLDIGAEFGYFSLLFSRLVGDYGRVLAFEPDPYSFEKLKANVNRNGYINITVVSKAVSENSQRTKFFVAKAKGTSSLFYPDEHGGEWIDTECLNIDDYLLSKQIKTIDFFKMDVEGAEAKVFKGMSRTIARARHDKRNLRGVVELSPRLLLASGITPEAFLENLKRYGFGLFFIDLYGQISESPPGELILRATQERHINIFCDLKI